MTGALALSAAALALAGWCAWQARRLAGEALAALAVLDAQRAEAWRELGDREQTLTREMLNRVQAPDAAVLAAMDAEDLKRGAAPVAKLHVSEDDEALADPDRSDLVAEVDRRLAEFGELPVSDLAPLDLRGLRNIVDGIDG